MRILLALSIVLELVLSVSGVNAATFEISPGQVIDIVGPYQPDQIYDVGVSAEVLAPNGAIPSGGVLSPFDQYGFQEFISFSGANIEVCGQNSPGPCATEPSNGVTFIGEADTTLVAEASGYSYFFDPSLGSFTTPIPNSDVEIFVTLPDGFSVAAVPEPSTWVMLLLGFAGIGAISRRRSSRLESLI
jgi:hypothetical protein